MTFWVLAVDTILAYLGATAVLFSSEIRLLPPRRGWRPRFLQAWSRFIGVLALLALDALIFAVMFSEAQPNLLVPMEATFPTFTLALCAWLWFRIARSSPVALGTFAAVYGLAVVVFTTVWAAYTMPGIGVALASPCALTIAGMVFVAVKVRHTKRRPRKRQ